MAWTAKELLEVRARFPTMTLEERKELSSLLRDVAPAPPPISFRDFVTTVEPRYRWWWHNETMARVLQHVADGTPGYRNVIISMPPRHGKQCSDNELALTTLGWKRHGDLAVGDYVFGPDGQPTRVVGLTDHIIDTDCEVEFTNGAKIVCHEAHEWLLYDRARTGAGPRVFETREIEKRVLWSGNGKPRCVLQLPERGALAMPEADLPVDPYVLGVWLGDGKSDAGQLCYAEKDAAVLDAVVARGWEPTSRWTHATTGVHYVGFTGLATKLRALGVLKNKHIPELYLRGSIDQRMALLAGLMDSDGHVEASTGRVRIVTVRPALRDQIMELVRGLGWEPYCTTVEPTTSSSGVIGRNPVHTVGFQPDRPIPCALPRKAVHVKALRRRVGVKAVRRVPPVAGKCIQVDRADGLYLVGRDLIPTHNSLTVSRLFVAYFRYRFPARHIGLASYTGELAFKHSRAAKRYFLKAGGALLGHRDEETTKYWESSQGGDFWVVGAGGSATGSGGHLLVLDDPLKDSLALDTPIPTPDGWTTMGEVRVGDRVFDENGRVVNVTGVSAVDDTRDCYEVHFSDGTLIVASGDHRWLTKAITPVGKRVRTTREIAATTRAAGDKSNHAVALAGPLDLPHRWLPISPYVLGLWLGDGSSTNAIITAGMEDRDQEVAELEREGMRVTLEEQWSDCLRGAWADLETLLPKGGTWNIRLGARGTARQGWFTSSLRFLGVWGNKHIPAMYLRASYEQRLALLQGLLDTDGTCTDEGQVVFAVTRRVLAEGVMELMRSLGWKPRWHEAEGGLTKPDPRFKKNRWTVYRVNGTPPRGQKVFRLARKQARVDARPEKRSRNHSRYIVAVKPCESVPVRCINVDSASHLFLAGEGMCPTHNSEEAKSVVIRTARIEWLKSTWNTRAEPNAAKLVVTTRWHPEDPAGYYLQQSELPHAEKWHVINFEAIRTDEPYTIQTLGGEYKTVEEIGCTLEPDPRPPWNGRADHEEAALCPERVPLVELLAKKVTSGSYWWGAMFQGRPKPREGNRFKAEWFTVVNAIPADVIRRARGWDTAGTDEMDKGDGNPDFTVGARLSLTRSGITVIEHVDRGRRSPGARNARMKVVADADAVACGKGKVKQVVEMLSGEQGRQRAAALVAAMAPNIVTLVAPLGDKEERAEPFAAQAEVGNVWILAGPWNAQFIDEMCAFPFGSHDDVVDAVAHAFNELHSGPPNPGVALPVTGAVAVPAGYQT